ncbi:delta-1-pyrroline-5-carboxylate synthase-like protein [Tanacetum coccineum]
MVITSALPEAFRSKLIRLLASREEIPELLKLDDVIDLVIPRGSNKLVSQIKNSTKIILLPLFLGSISHRIGQRTETRGVVVVFFATRKVVVVVAAHYEASWVQLWWQTTANPKPQWQQLGTKNSRVVVWSRDKCGKGLGAKRQWTLAVFVLRL